MSVEFLGKEISGVFTIPSGEVMTSVSVLERFAQEIPEIGILTTKSISKEPRGGNDEPIFAQNGPGSFINAVGLANPGADEFVKQLRSAEIPKKRFLLGSIVGGGVKGFMDAAEVLYGDVDGLELNVSCPHADKEGQTIGQDYDLVAKIIKEVRTLGKPIMVKLSPKADIEKSVEVIHRERADGITAINTYGPEQFSIDGHPVLYKGFGGLSGKQILETGIDYISRLRQRTNLPIIGCGGISSVEDVLRHRDNGVNFFGIGSATAGMNFSENKVFFRTINEDLKNGTNFAKDLLKTKLNMEYRKITVSKKEQLAEDLFLLRFNQRIEAQPGQFVLLGQLGKEGEKPFSVYSTDPFFEVLFQVRGCRTEQMSKLEKNDDIYVRGPYGNSPEVNGRLLLVGGGCGVAAMKLFTERGRDTVTMMGVKDIGHLPKINTWKTGKKIIYSNDGSVGIKGNVTDGLEKAIMDYKPNYVLACGPKGMLEQVVIRGTRLMDPKRILISEELPTMCGVGICGRCATKDGRRNCVDGTFLS